MEVFVTNKLYNSTFPMQEDEFFDPKIHVSQFYDQSQGFVTKFKAKPAGKNGLNVFCL